MTLSAREEQVLRLMTTQGLCTTKQLAHEMGLSPRTVEIYRGGLFHKMHVRNAAELMRRVFTDRLEQR